MNRKQPRNRRKWTDPMCVQNRYLLNQTPEGWLAAIGTIRNASMRLRIARIVWWDYSDKWGRKYRSGMDLFKPFLDIWNVPKRASAADVAAALVQVGFHPTAAEYRVETSELFKHDKRPMTPNTFYTRTFDRIAV